MKVLRVIQKVSLLLAGIILLVGIIFNAITFCISNSASKKYDALVSEGKENGYPDIYSTCYFEDDLTFDEVDYYSVRAVKRNMFEKISDTNILIKKDDEFVKDTDSNSDLIIIGKKLALLEPNEDKYPYNYLIIDAYKILDEKDFNNDKMFIFTLKLDFILVYVFVITFLLFILVTVICLVKQIISKTESKIKKDNKKTKKEKE